MESLGPTHSIWLLLAVAIVSATCGFIASAAARRNKRRALAFFFLGFFCGFIAGPILRGRRRGLHALGAAARCAYVRPPTTAMRRQKLWPPQWHRRISHRLPLGYVPSRTATRAGTANALMQRRRAH
jgi:hypothetical protein